MKITTPCLSSVSGRFVGAYVYMVVCKEGADIRIKVGMSDDPIRRLNALMTGCPLIPKILCTAELPNRQLAYKVEGELHSVLEEWHTNGEWFQFSESDKPRFNAAWQAVFRAFSSPMRPLSWTKIWLKPLLNAAKKRRKYAQHRYMTGGSAYQDFKRTAPR